MPLKAWLVGIVGLALFLGVAVGVAGMLVAGSGSGSLSVGDPAEVPAEPTATPYEKRLTGTEAAAIVETGLNNSYHDEWARCQTDILPSGFPPGASPPAYCTGFGENYVIGKDYLWSLEDCQALEFNESGHNWIVQCEQWVTNTASGLRLDKGVKTYRVSDETSDYGLVSGS